MEAEVLGAQRNFSSLNIMFESKAANLGHTVPSMSMLRLMELPREQDLTCTSRSPLLPRLCLSLHTSLLSGFSPSPVFGRALQG